MSDIVDRLRAWVYTSTLYTTASEAADEIERLRRQVSLQQNLTLTDEEREAAKYFSQWGLWTAAQKHADALRNLLERLA